MKILEKAIMPDGTAIQLEDWSDKNTKEYPNLYGLCIGAYPVAKRSGKYRIVRENETFRLSISMNPYQDYTNEQVKEDYAALVNGTKSLQDMCSHFGNGEKDKWYLGMETEQTF